jgi:hypothetical protein
VNGTRLLKSFFKITGNHHFHHPVTGTYNGGEKRTNDGIFCELGGAGLGFSGALMQSLKLIPASNRGCVILRLPNSKLHFPINTFCGCVCQVKIQYVVFFDQRSNVPKRDQLSAGQ